MRKRLLKGATVMVAAATSIAMAGCSGQSGPTGGTSDGQVTLSVGVFGSFGFKEAGLYDAFMEKYPNVTIEESSPQNETDYWSALQTRLAGNSGLADIQAIEVGRLAGVKENQADKFVDLATLEGWDGYAADFLTWKLDLAKTAEGRQVAAGTDIGPVGMCYKPDLFEAAGMPTDPDEVAALWPGGWKDYVEAGRRFMANAPGDTKWTDSAAGLFRAAMGVTGEKYTDTQGELIWESSSTVKDAWQVAVDAVDGGQVTTLTQFSPEWNQAFSTEAYASIPCPAWMLTYIKGQAGEGGSGQWAVADAPAPGNVGGAYLAIPEASQNKEMAWELVKFLTEASSQQAVFEKAGNFPSNTAAIDSSASFADPYFSDTNTGEVLGQSAANLPTPQVIGVHDGDVETALMNALNEVAQQSVEPNAAWENAVAAITAATR
ncbi:MAG: extracellular solute-binding protein [Propioniciclava sp.]